MTRLNLMSFVNNFQYNVKQCYTFSSSLNFEAGYVYNGDLFIINKSVFRDVNIYKVSNNVLIPCYDLGISSVTDCEIYKNELYILSYNGLYHYEKKIDSFLLGQVESLSIINGDFYINNEGGLTFIRSRKDCFINYICLFFLLVVLSIGLKINVFSKKA